MPRWLIITAIIFMTYSTIARWCAFKLAVGWATTTCGCGS